MIPIAKIKEDYGIEIATVVLACRVHFKTSTIGELQSFIIANEIKWERVLSISNKHSIRPLVYKILADVTKPEPVAAKIKEEYFSVITKSWQQAIETERLINLLKANGILAVPYKGTVFSKQFYGDLISRESSDIDLIIKTEDLEKVIASLERDGYISASGFEYQCWGQKYFKYYKDYNLNKFKQNDIEFHIELHWAVAEYYLGINEKSSNLLYQVDNTKQQIIKTEVDFLCSNAHFLAVLIHHSVKDSFKSLKNIIDISQILQNKQSETDSEFISENVALLHINKAFALANIISTNIFGVSSTYQIHHKISPNQLHYFLTQLLSENIINSHSLKSIQLFKNRLQLCDSFSSKLRFISPMIHNRFIPTIVDFRIILLPKPLFFLYSIFKPFRSLIKPYNAKEEKQRLIPK